MKKFLKILFKLVLILGIAAGAAYGGYYGYQQYQKREQAKATFTSRPDVEKAKDGTSISPGHHNLAYFKRQLNEKYPDVYSAAYETPRASKIGSSVVIPGQVVTPSYDFNKKKITDADSMTPQGLTVAGKYLKTIQVPGAPHLGGVAYDPIAKNIWVTGSQDDSSALMSFSLKKLEKYSYNKKKQPIKYDNVISLPTIERASCVTYYDNQLFVGFFNTDGQGQIASYPIARSGNFKGTITSDQIKAVTGQVSWALGSGSASMDRQIQGIAFYQNWIILSQSYGSKDSKLYFFPISALNNLDEGNAEKVVIMPPYLEQIYVQNGQLLMLFESGSKAYARDQIMIVDRILSANINALLGG